MVKNMSARVAGVGIGVISLGALDIAAIADGYMPDMMR
jgi:hypothetical protein